MFFYFCLPFNAVANEMLSKETENLWRDKEKILRHIRNNLAKNFLKVADQIF